ncbi:hypothetical protein [Prevotella intermedia]|uniref:hypothetical protein n=1 Tax=Prevotella intermedia TaxID=28131 RepID=UPI001C12B586|nr:hypothetical protein [Prevotella intermedia]
MYSTREKLVHFNQLVNPLAVEADLALLHEKNPQSTDFVRFDHAPEKNSEDILFALLDVCEHDEIVRNRREFFAAKEADNEHTADGKVSGTPTDDEGNGTPTDDEGNSTPTDDEGNGTPTDDEGNGTPTDDEGNGALTDDEGNSTPTDGEGNGTPAEDTGAETNNVDNSVDNSSEEGKGNQPKKPAAPKKKKKSTPK